jgi:HK97 gp10 family phage protein
MPGFNNILNFIGIYNDKKFETLHWVGEFCVGKMNYYVPVDTGYLKSRNTYEVTRLFFQRLRLKNDAFYAGFIEFGTSKMQAQPFIRPSIENHLDEIRRIAGGVWDGL